MADHLEAAIVGLGWWGRQIVDSLTGSDRIRVTHAVDPQVDVAADFASANDLELHDDLDDVLGDPDITAVIIATPHALHEEQVIAAARVGKEVFCEKPLALESPAARRMLAVCEQHGITLGIGHERRFEGAMEEAARIAHAGELGTLLHVECNWSHNLFMGATPSTWRQDPSQAPAGTLTALGVHITDYFQSVCGRVASLRAVTGDRSANFPGDDVLTVQFQFESGVSGVLSNLATTPFYSRISIFGDRSWVEIREHSNVNVPEPALLTRRGMDGEIHTRTYAHTDTVRANLEQWAGAALGIDTYRFSMEELLHNIEILEAIVRSAENATIERPG